MCCCQVKNRRAWCGGREHCGSQGKVGIVGPSALFLPAFRLAGKHTGSEEYEAKKGSRYKRDEEPIPTNHLPPLVEPRCEAVLLL